MQQNEVERGTRFALGTSVALATVMSYRVIKLRAPPMPSAALAAMGAVASAYFGYKYSDMA